MSDTNPF